MLNFALCVKQWPKQLNTDISEVDPEIVDIIEHEKNRQWKVWKSSLQSFRRCKPEKDESCWLSPGFDHVLIMV